jgi:DNA-binding MarR family transcriptional regulator
MRGRRPNKDDAEALRLIYVIELAIHEENLPAHAGTVLSHLMRVGGEASLSDVREACRLGRSQASRVAEALEARGLIEKFDGEDGRYTEIRLTDQGRSVIERIIQAVQPNK